MKFVNQKGSFAVILGLFVGVFALCGILFLAFSGNSGKRDIASDPKGAFEALKTRVDQAMNNPATVEVSVERNPNSFACLYSSQGDCQNKGGIFLYYETVEPTAQPISQLVKSNGFGYDGIACTGFPSAECAFRVESSWIPVCSAPKCDNTKSFKMKNRVVFDAGSKEPPQEWSREELYSPLIKLSQATVCERDGRIWANGECISQDQAAQRSVASANSKQPEGTIEGGNQAQEVPVVMPDGQQEPQASNPWVCPNTIVLQGQEYYLEILQPGRGQVHVPAVNGCANVSDTFIFQCVQKTPAAFEGEGQWVQVEAQMAPSCQAQEPQASEPYTRQ